MNLVTGTVSTGTADTYLSYGISNPNTPACTVAADAMAAAPGVPITGALSITGCDSTAANASWATFAFADYLGLAPRTQVVIADYIYGTLMFRAGWR